jgi:hypothetical protein
MNATPQSDPVDEAVAAFRQMPVPPPPSDAGVLAQLPADLPAIPAPSSGPLPWFYRSRKYFVAASIAAAGLLAVGGALYLWNRPSGQLAGRDLSAVKPRPPSNTATRGGELLAEGTPQRGEMRAAASMTPARQVANAQVIVVAKALDAQAAQPQVRGDLPEHLIRYQVERVLKGELRDEIIFIRTPTAPDEFLGKEWILLLPPDYMAGKHLYAATWNIKSEPEIRRLIENP